MSDEKTVNSTEERLQAETPKERKKRGKMLLDKKMQFSYLSLMLVTWFVMLLNLIATNVMFAIVFEQTLIQHQIALDVAKDVKNFALIILGIALVPLIVVGICALVHSHRIAGPLYRLKQSIQRMCEGDYDFRLQFRRNDFLHDVADMMDSLLVNLHSRNVSLQQLRERIEKLISGLTERSASVEIARELSEVAQQLGNIVSRGAVVSTET